jgi:hypothetical protein
LRLLTGPKRRLSRPIAIEVVAAREADGLERFAAEELQCYLGCLFDVSASIVSEPPFKARWFKI